MDRRELLKLGSAAVVGAAALPAAGEAHKAKRRPNVLIFFTDDHGQWLEQAAGNTEVQTPNMLRLAENGVRMRNAFCTTPVCSPARASFWTGRMPSQHGIHDWVMEEPGYQDRPWLQGQTLISELIQRAGYRTGLVGKWHCGQQRIPQRGFDEWYSFWQKQQPHAGVQNMCDEGKQEHPEGVQSEILTEHAVKFLRDHKASHKEKPFFLYVGYTDTHSPHKLAPEDMMAKYTDATFRDIPDETFDPATHGRVLRPVTPGPVQRQLRQEYYAAVSQIDHEMGKVLAELEALGEADNTLVIYTGDHGLNAGHHGIWEKGNETVPQNFFEESIRVCCTFSWPQGGVPRGLSSELPVNQCDLFMTLLEVAGATPDATTLKQIASPGRSYWSALHGEVPTDWRNGIIIEYGNARMMSRDGYKLILRYPYGGQIYPHEFYDLRADPREKVNLYAKATTAQREIIASMTKAIDDYFAVYTVAGKSGLELEKQPAATTASPWLQPAQAPKPA